MYLLERSGDRNPEQCSLQLWASCSSFVGRIFVAVDILAHHVLLISLASNFLHLRFGLFGSFFCNYSLDRLIHSLLITIFVATHSQRPVQYDCWCVGGVLFVCSFVFAHIIH